MAHCFYFLRTVEALFFGLGIGIWGDCVSLPVFYIGLQPPDD